MFILAKESALRGISILLLEGGPHKEYSLSAKSNAPLKSYSNRVSAVNKLSVQLLQSVGAWQIIEDIEGCNAVKEMRVSVLKIKPTTFFSFFLNFRFGILVEVELEV